MHSFDVKGPRPVQRQKSRSLKRRLREISAPEQSPARPAPRNELPARHDQPIARRTSSEADFRNRYAPRERGNLAQAASDAHAPGSIVGLHRRNPPPPSRSPSQGSSHFSRYVTHSAYSAAPVISM